MLEKIVIDTRIDDAIQEYAAIHGQYESFRVKLDRLLHELLEDSSLPFHLVESRTKTINSFADKIRNPSKSYEFPIAEIPDLCGCRVITYYHDDVGKIADIIKREFEVVEEELSHQQSSIAADRFGYLSVHYVVKVGPERKSLREWAAVSEFHAEIQIRTVVQHAWSAVSHALQYKSGTKIPSQLQRRLYRIAGLFELADEEFVGIRNQRLALDKAAVESLSSGVTEIPLSSSSIIAFANDWYAKSSMKEVVASRGIKFVDSDDDRDQEYASDIYQLAEASEIKLISELSECLDGKDGDFLRDFYDMELARIGDRAKSLLMTPAFGLLLAFIGSRKVQVDDEFLLETGWSPDRAQSLLKARK